MEKKQAQFVLLALAPFLCFLVGYGTIALVVHEPPFEAPSFIGLNLPDAVIKLSRLQLNARVMAQRIDPTVAEGTILSQTPTPGTRIKAQQSIYLVIARKPQKMLTPQLCGLRLPVAEERAQEQGIRLQIIKLASTDPAQTVIGQSPAFTSELPQPANMVVYVSTGQIAKQYLMPSLVGLPFGKAKAWLEGRAIKCVTDGIVAPETEIEDQKPRAGTYVDVTKPLTVYLSAQKVPAVPATPAPVVTSATSPQAPTQPTDTTKVPVTII